MLQLEQQQPTSNFVLKSIQFAKQARYYKITLETSKQFIATLLNKNNNRFLLVAGQVSSNNSTLLYQYYSVQAKAFSKEDAAILAKYRLYKMSINLEKEKNLPYRLLYSLLATKAKILQEYINKNLARGQIR